MYLIRQQQQEDIKHIPIMNQIRGCDDNALHEEAKVTNEDPNVKEAHKKTEDEVTKKINNDLKDKDLFENESHFVKPREEVQLKQNRCGLGYEKDHGKIFHILYHKKPLSF